MTENSVIEKLKREIVRLEESLADGQLARVVEDSYNVYRVAVNNAEEAQKRLEDAKALVSTWEKFGDRYYDAKEVSVEWFEEMKETVKQSAADHGIKLYTDPDPSIGPGSEEETYQYWQDMQNTHTREEA